MVLIQEYKIVITPKKYFNKKLTTRFYIKPQNRGIKKASDGRTDGLTDMLFWIPLPFAPSGK